MNYINSVCAFMKYLIDKYGLFAVWACVASLIALYKLDMILGAVYLLWRGLLN